MKDSNNEKVENNLTYDRYLCLDKLLGAQKPLSNPPHHDELLFIIQHQTSELWMKLILYEIGAAIQNIQNDQLDPCFKILARVKLIQRQLFEQWAVLETLTPTEYVKFRNVLQQASGLHSLQYRSIEFVLGNKNKQALTYYKKTSKAYTELKKYLEAPSLYEEFILYLHRRNYAIPNECINQEWSVPHQHNGKLIDVFAQIYTDPNMHWDAYNMCEKLVDIEEQFQLWRFRHMKTVERIIGYKSGTGGTTGVPYLEDVLKVKLFPELIDVRTMIGESTNV
ncbi:MAG: tryptophan 2,3-dioxygenase [Gammaproteobacteria bacterium]